MHAIMTCWYAIVSRPRDSVLLSFRRRCRQHLQYTAQAIAPYVLCLHECHQLLHDRPGSMLSRISQRWHSQLPSLGVFVDQTRDALHVVDALSWGHDLVSSWHTLHVRALGQWLHQPRCIGM